MDNPTTPSSARLSAPPLDLGDGLRMVAVTTTDGERYVLLLQDAEAVASGTAAAWVEALTLLTSEGGGCPMNTPSPTEPTLDRLAIELASLRAELDFLRRQLGDEVRTRRLVVVDEQGAERVTTRISDTLTTLEVEAPSNGNGNEASAVQLAAAWNEADDDQGRPMGHACVSVSTKGYPGAQLLALDLDGGPAFARNPKTGLNEVQPVVEGRVWVFDDRGNDGAALSADGLRFTR